MCDRWKTVSGDSVEGFYATLTTAEIRRRQYLTRQEIEIAHRDGLTDALSALREQEDALTAEMVRRLQKGNMNTSAPAPRWTVEVDDSVPGLTYLVRDYAGEPRARFMVGPDANRYADGLNAKIQEREERVSGGASADSTDAPNYVATAKRNRVDYIAALLDIVADPIEALAASYRIAEVGGQDDPGWSVDAAQETAEELLREMPLCVDATTTFEIVLGTGGPDSRLLIECDASQPHMGGDGPYGDVEYEIRRILYRYSWNGSGELELTGSDYRAAESFAERVIPELAE